MKLISDCLEIKHLDQYAKCSIDRIIVSLPHVSARPARVYTMEELKEIVKFAHELGLEVGVNMLNFVMEDDLDKFQDALLFCKDNKIDRIYFADMGVYWMAKEMKMEHLLIYQPTTLIASSQDANEYLRLGIDRVVLAREITFDDMKHILSHCHGCEVSVFGYNVMMHSRRKLLSSYFEFCGLEDRSASKELYLMEETRDEKMPIIQDETGTFVLSGTIFCMFSKLMELENCDFRIEGIHLDEELIFQVARDIQRILLGEISGDKVYESYSKAYPQYAFSEGFMYKKTTLVKEAGQ